MGSIAMDLDSSLDDIISRKRNQQNRGRQQSSFQSQQQRRSNNPMLRRSQNDQQRGGRLSSSFSSRSDSRGITARLGGISVASRSKTINKSILQRTNLVSRGNGLSTIQRPKSISTASLSNRRAKTDPSQIVITKSVSRRNDVPTPTREPLQPTGYAQRPSSGSGSSLSIRGLSGTNSNGLTIRGESGPASVLISNLDPGANAEDVKLACQVFGPILRCEVFMDRSGRSFGEAEVEFANKASALECIAKLDNEIADGRVLRAVLRTRPTASAPPSSSASSSHTMPQSSFAAQTLRSVIAPSRSGYTTASSTGKLYSDSMIPTGPAAAGAPHQDYSRYHARRY